MSRAIRLRSRPAERRAAWVFLTPSLLLYGLYVLFPVLFTFYLSVTEWDGLSTDFAPICWADSSRSCLENFRELLEDDVFLKSLGNNLVWLISLALAPVIGLFLALFFHVKGWMASLCKSFLFLPMVFSLVVVGLVWGWFMQPHFGLLEFLLNKAGLLGPEQHVGILSSERWVNLGVIVTTLWPQSAYCMILYLAGLSGLQKNVIEAALVDGVSRWQMLWHIVIPMLRPTTVIVVIVTAISAFRAFDLVAVMTQGGPFNSSNVLAHYMYEQTFVNFRYGYGAAIAVVLFLMSLVLIVLYLRQVQKSE